MTKTINDAYTYITLFDGSTDVTPQGEIFDRSPQG